ncbi:MAG: hypothetical protein PUB42_03690 [Firmicutes bacterium]|nr:hypothetical protein [Bacillota bacterium]
MTNYLIMPGKMLEQYFYKPYEGICMRRRHHADLWSEHEQVIEHAKDGFGIYSDSAGAVHIICITDDNQLTYAVRKNGIWKKYVISKLNEDIFVRQMRLYNVGGRLNLLYSALYNGETLLIHCILGNHAKPSTVAALESEHFCIYSNRAYFTNSEGVLGFVSLSDEKPSGFNPMYEDAHNAYVCGFQGKEFFVFTRSSALFINGEEILSDNRMEQPICIRGSNRVYVMWKSGGFVRYITTFNLGSVWSEPMRFMSTGKTITLFEVQQGDAFSCYYGYQNTKDIVLFGKGELFREESEYNLPAPNELEKLKILLDITRQEVLDAKKEISRLNSTVDKLKGSR